MKRQFTPPRTPRAAPHTPSARSPCDSPAEAAAQHSNRAHHRRPHLPAFTVTVPPNHQSTVRRSTIGALPGALAVASIVLDLDGVSGAVDSLPGTYIDQLFRNEKYHTPFTAHSLPDIDPDHIRPNGLVN